MPTRKEYVNGYFYKRDYFTGSKSNFDRLPRGYLFLNRGLFWQGKIKRISKHVPGGKVLDIGCGYGFLLYFMKERYEIHGCDLSPHAIRMCKKIFPDLPSERFFVHNITEELPFPEEHFDVIICQDVIEHIKDITTPLQNIHKALKKGSIFLFKIPIKTRNRISEALRLDKDPTHVSVHYEEDLMKILREIGFKLLERRYVWWGGVPMPRFIKSGSDISMILQKK